MSADSNQSFPSKEPSSPSEVIDVQIVENDHISQNSPMPEVLDEDLWEDVSMEPDSSVELSETPEMVDGETEEGFTEEVLEEVTIATTEPENLDDRLLALQQEYQRLKQQVSTTQNSLNTLLQTSLSDLESRRKSLEVNIEQLERKRDRLQQEINRSFPGSSQDIAIRLQGFKDYLVGSLQDLVVIVEDMQVPTPKPIPPEPTVISSPPPSPEPKTPRQPQFGEPPFKATQRRIKDLLDQYRTAPDYYGPPWQIRRTVEPIHIDRIQFWFSKQGGRGSLKSLGSRLQNILVTATIISILTDLYGDRLQTLILANMPERLGEWRRGLQDCLGLSRGDFGPDGGIMLFEDPEAVAQRADRLVNNQEMPLIIVDNSDNQISLSLLQFPLWLAFASEPQQPTNDFRY